MNPRRAILALAVILLLAVAPGAHAQNATPFDSLPPATPEQTETQATTTTTDTNGGIETWQAVLIVIGGVILLGGIGIAIARDARRRAPLVDAAAADHRDADAHKHARATKQRQRQRAKAARAARRKNR